MTYDFRAQIHITFHVDADNEGDADSAYQAALLALTDTLPQGARLSSYDQLEITGSRSN